MSLPVGPTASAVRLVHGSHDEPERYSPGTVLVTAHVRPPSLLIADPLGAVSGTAKSPPTAIP
jgi:hypothetical protein